jgi:hypothetical protein
MIYENLTVEEIDRQIREALYSKDRDKIYYLIRERARRFSGRHKISNTYLLSLIEKNIRICDEFSKLLRKQKRNNQRARK